MPTGVTMLKSRRVFPCFAIGISVLALPVLVMSANSVTQSLSSLGWKERTFSGSTQYTLETHDGTLAIKGHANGTASALYRDVSVDLESTPVLSWQWKVSNVFENGVDDEKEKSGDDFPARLYVVYQRGLFKWSTVAINYVWSSQYPVGETWDSAYTDKSKIIVLQSGDTKAGMWTAEKRNIAEDFKTLFGIDVTHLDGYALMVDGDNTGGVATSWFSRIAFNEE